jgi:oxygen-independent coproporphyrinogen-3 oxidase
VYVHVPFCVRRCDYCDFATWTDRAHLVDAYVDACVADLRRHERAADRPPPATSVFFGGGTPSVLTPDQLGRILAAVERTADAEVTAECNPDGVDEERLAGYRAAGVNRLSFGVQSMAGHVLASLGRTHRPENVARAVAAARSAGFATLNLDLIYGAAGESLDDWAATLDGALALDPPHVSAYALTVEPGTPLAGRIAVGEVTAPDDDDQAAKYELADERLGAAGLACYEISNWARPGHECRHNLLYWRQHDYLGIGCAAHGHTAGRRWWTVRTPERYIRAVEEGRNPVAGGERLDDDGRAEEALALALRTRDGVVLARPDDGRTARRVDGVLTELAELGLVDAPAVDPAVPLRVTRPGRLVANDVTARLLAAGARAAGHGRLAGTR